MHWHTTRYRIDLSQPRVMGIVNVTPDSFSDGGRFDSASAAAAHCETLVREGADILDIGGESSRPGAPTLSTAEEWHRIEPVLREAVGLGVPVSVDSCKPEVMQRALDMGADILNDIRALQAPGALEVAASHGSCGVCLMHMQGATPAQMQQAPAYLDVIAEVTTFLAARVGRAKDAGIDAQRLVLDPGFGFGKTPAHNIELARRLHQLLNLGHPLLVGWSRKSTLGVITGKPVQDRLPGSLAAALAAVERGARVLRVHDVAATVDALKVWQALAPPVSAS
jgi:dihydropteroate synthase